MKDGIKVENLKEVQDMLEVLGERIDDIRPALHEAGAIVQNVTEESLEKGVSPWGDVWTPLAEATMKKKGVSAGSPMSMGKLLYESGRMRESLYVTLGMDGASVEIGMNAKSSDGYAYPAVHQFGTEDGHIPARPFLPIDSNGDLERRVADEILEVFESHLKI